MKIESIKRHLAPYGIHAKRATTINHAFSSALAPTESWDPQRAEAAMRILGQTNLTRLSCVYCTRTAQTWDHLEPMVRNSLPSGFGHTLGNLVPACRDCNSSKGNKPWRDWVAAWDKMPSGGKERLESYVTEFLPRQRTIEDWEREFPSEMAELRRCWSAILDSMKKADKIVEELRNRGTEQLAPTDHS